MQGFIDWFVLNESKQQIENLGFPPVVASIFQAEFNKNAYHIAKWYKEYFQLTGEGDWCCSCSGSAGCQARCL